MRTMLDGLWWILRAYILAHMVEQNGLLSCHGKHREARTEFGDVVASALKLSQDGTRVLWPQPSDDPEDPQNVRNDFYFITQFN